MTLIGGGLAFIDGRLPPLFRLRSKPVPAAAETFLENEISSGAYGLPASDARATFGSLSDRPAVGKDEQLLYPIVEPVWMRDNGTQ